MQVSGFKLQVSGLRFKSPGFNIRGFFIFSHRGEQWLHSDFRRYRSLATVQSVNKVDLQDYFAGHVRQRFGLRDQIRKASVSIMSNIAEGFERSGNKEFIQFLATAKGSAGEVRAQLYVALDQGYVEEPIFTELNQSVTKISMMLSGLITYLQRTTFRGTKFKREA